MLIAIPTKLQLRMGLGGVWCLLATFTSGLQTTGNCDLLARSKRPPPGHNCQWALASRKKKVECLSTQDSGFYEIDAQKREIEKTRHAKRKRKKKLRGWNWKSATKAEPRKGEIIGSLNIESTRNSVISEMGEEGHRLRANGFNLRHCKSYEFRGARESCCGLDAPKRP